MATMVTEIVTRASVGAPRPGTSNTLLSHRISAARTSRLCYSNSLAKQFRAVSSLGVLKAHGMEWGRLCPWSRQGKREEALQVFHLNIRCARVGGIEIPNNKRIETSLRYIHGVGKTTARQVLLDAGMENKHTRELTEEELTNIRDEVSKYMIEGDLRRFNTLAIKRLKEIQCYRGRRHIMNLPCRGQHTQCNARTRKGKKRITVAGKKKSPK